MRNEPTNCMEKIFTWAWRHGLDVTMTSRAYAIPVSGPFRLHREAPDYRYVAGEQLVVEIPVLRFSRGDRYEEVTATNWANMVEMMRHAAPYIATKLCIKELDL